MYRISPFLSIYFRFLVRLLPGQIEWHLMFKLLKKKTIKVTDFVKLGRSTKKRYMYVSTSVLVLFFINCSDQGCCHYHNNSTSVKSGGCAQANFTIFPVKINEQLAHSRLHVLKYIAHLLVQFIIFLRFCQYRTLSFSIPGKIVIASLSESSPWKPQRRVNR